MKDSYEIQFTCDHCGDTLPVEEDKNRFLRCNEYHDCFGEEVGLIAMATSDGVTVNTTGVSLELNV